MTAFYNLTMSFKAIGINAVKANLNNLANKFPEVNRKTLNNMVYHSYQMAQANVAKTFTNRNTWTKRMLGYQKAGRSFGSYAVVGSREEYMADQELGDASHDVPNIPTILARTSKNPNKLVSRKKRLRNYSAAKLEVTTVSDLQTMMAIAKRRKEKGEVYKLNYMRNGKRVKGLAEYRHRGPRKLVLIHNLSKKKVKINSKPWLSPVVKPTMDLAPTFFAKNLSAYLNKTT